MERARSWSGAALFLFVLSGCGATTVVVQGTPSDAGSGVDAAPPQVDDDAGAVDAAPPPVDAGPDVDNGAPSSVYPAPHPDAPQILSGGGPVITAPVYIPITFDGDPMRADIETFLSKIGESTYWHTVTGEYGVGAGKSGTPIHLSEAAPQNIASADIATWLAGKLDGTHPEFPPPDANTIYVINYPTGTTVQLDTFGASCTTWGGYHESTQLANGTNVIYAVLPRCTYQGEAPLDTLTFSTSHELIEASTDPIPSVSPAYYVPDDAHIYWALVPLSEVGDMCSYRYAPPLKPTDIGYAVQRTWSNASAKAGHDPCVPAVDGQAYFNAAPVLTDDVTMSFPGSPPITTKGVKIPVGQTKTIDVDLFSDGKTSLMDVEVFDAAQLSGGKGTLQLSLDRKSGVNGEKLHLTITPTASGQYGGSEFVLLTTIGQTSNFWAGWVSN